MDRQRILNREEYLKNLRIKGIYWDEEGRIIGKADFGNKVDIVEKVEKVVEIVEKVS